MLTIETIEAIQRAKGIVEANETMPFGVAALPQDFTMRDLEQFQSERRRPRGLMSTTNIDAFLLYSRDHAESGATIFVDAERMQASCVLNLGTNQQPGHTDNRANLSLEKTAAYKALTGIETPAELGTGHTQLRLAEFLEDWAPHIECFNDSKKISAAAAAAAVKKMTIEQATKALSEEGVLGNTRSAFEEVQSVTGGDVLPSLIYFTCMPYVGLAERLFVMRVGVITSGSKPVMTLRIIKREEHAQEMAVEFVSVIDRGLEALAKSDVGTFPDITVLIGSYTASK